MPLWRDDAKCAGATSMLRARWLLEEEKLPIAEAKLRIISQFPRHFPWSADFAVCAPTMLCSSPALVKTFALETCVSPPRDWPRAFMENVALKLFIGRGTLCGKRCRLVSRLDLAAASLLQLHVCDSFLNASVAKSALGWRIVRGFAVYESREDIGTFIAVQHWWNECGGGAWVDLTPRSVHRELVLVETALGNRLPVELTIGDDGVRVSKNGECSADYATPSACIPRKPELSASLMPHCPTRDGALLEKSRKSRAQRQDELVQHVRGTWRVYQRWVSSGRLRLLLESTREGGQTFELEAQSWGTCNDEADMSKEMFAPLEPDDECAAQLRCRGRWEVTKSGLKLAFEEVVEIGPGVAQLPLKSAHVLASTGVDLSRPVYMTRDVEERSLIVEVGSTSDYCSRHVKFERSHR